MFISFIFSIHEIRFVNQLLPIKTASYHQEGFVGKTSFGAFYHYQKYIGQLVNLANWWPSFCFSFEFSRTETHFLYDKHAGNLMTFLSGETILDKTKFSPPKWPFSIKSYTKSSSLYKNIFLFLLLRQIYCFQILHFLQK